MTQSNRTHFLIQTARAELSHEVYLDFQRYLYQRFHLPTCIFARQVDGSLITLTPDGQLASICDQLRKHFPAEECRKHQLHHSLELISMFENAPEGITTRVHRCNMGLDELYVPIRAPRRSGAPNSGELLGVLLIGQFLQSQDELAALERRFKEKSSNTSAISQICMEIPVLSGQELDGWADTVAEATTLAATIGARAFASSQYNHGLEFIHTLDLERRDRNAISEVSVWDCVLTACTRLVDYLKLSSAAVYISHRDNPAILDQKVCYANALGCASQVEFASLHEFQWATSQDAIDLPRESDSHLGWIDPILHFGDGAAFAFAREFTMGQRLLIGFGYNPQRRLSFVKRMVLYEAVNSKLLPFLENSLFAVYLDELMAETGHLLGRARGRATTGIRTLIDEFLAPATNKEDEELRTEAIIAAEDGLKKLDLIQQNFYSFAYLRVPNATTAVSYDDEPFDAISLLEGSLRFLQHALGDEGSRVIHFSKNCDRALVRGSATQFSLVLENLYDNALKFRYAETYLTVKANAVGTAILLSVENLGIGIPAGELTAVFQALRRASWQDPVKRVEGLGLGLAYCKRVVEGLGGTIRIHSRPAQTQAEARPIRFEGDNYLTTVIVKLPLLANDRAN